MIILADSTETERRSAYNEDWIGRKKDLDFKNVNRTERLNSNYI